VVIKPIPEEAGTAVFLAKATVVARAAEAGSMGEVAAATAGAVVGVVAAATAAAVEEVAAGMADETSNIQHPTSNGQRSTCNQCPNWKFFDVRG
jgi:hypothetical protein